MSEKKVEVPNGNKKVNKKQAKGIMHSTCSKYISHEDIDRYFNERFDDNAEFSVEDLKKMLDELAPKNEKGERKVRANFRHNPSSQMADPKKRKGYDISPWHYDMGDSIDNEDSHKL